MWKVKTKFILLLIAACFKAALLLHPDQVNNYERLYELGMTFYRQEFWEECSKYFDLALKDYHFHRNSVINCRLKCYDGNDDFTLINLETILETANCVRLCKKKILGPRAEEEISNHITKKFEDRAPYNYLSFCLYKVSTCTCKYQLEKII